MSAGTDLYVETLGPRHAMTSLLFMHGGMGLDHTCFRPFVDPLADVTQLVYMDHRLNGRSPRTSARSVTLRTMVEDAAAVAAATCEGKVIPVGHSFGAVVALAMAAWVPSSVHGVVLVGSGHSPTVGATLVDYVGRHGTVAQQEVIAKAFSGQLTTDEELGAAFRSILSLYLHRPDEQLTRRVLARTSFSAHGFNTFVASALGQIDYREALPKLEVPALFIAGSSDWLEQDPSGGSKAAARLAPHGTCITLDECGHFPFAEQPLGFCAAIRGWLRTEIDEHQSASDDAGR